MVDPKLIVKNQSINDEVIFELTCIVCTKIVDRDFLTCTECWEMFCRKCYLKSYNINRNCPMKHYQPVIQKPSRQQEMLLSMIQVRCPNSENMDGEKCPEVLDYIRMIDHQQTCKYMQIQCQFCDFRTSLEKLEQHENYCPFRLHKCEFCEQQVSKQEWFQHNQSCGSKYVTCCYCFNQVYLQTLEDHFSICNEFKILCHHCLQEKTKQEFEQHESDCNYQFVKCDGCDEEFWKKDIESHLEVCTEVKINCEDCEKLHKKSEKHQEWQCIQNLKVQLSNITQKLQDENIKLIEQNSQQKSLILLLQKDLENEKNKNNINNQKNQNLTKNNLNRSNPNIPNFNTQQGFYEPKQYPLETHQSINKSNTPQYNNQFNNNYYSQFQTPQRSHIPHQQTDFFNPINRSFNEFQPQRPFNDNFMTQSFHNDRLNDLENQINKLNSRIKF